MGGADLGFYLRDRQGDQGHRGEHGQAEVDVDVGEQSALGDHVVLEQLERSEARVTASADRFLSDLPAYRSVNSRVSEIQFGLLQRCSRAPDRGQRRLVASAMGTSFSRAFVSSN